MKWDYEILDEKIVRDLSYATVKEELYSDISKFGLKRALIKITGNFNQIDSVKAKMGTSEFVDTCDNAFRIIAGSFTAIVDVVDEMQVNINCTYWKALTTSFNPQEIYQSGDKALNNAVALLKAKSVNPNVESKTYDGYNILRSNFSREKIMDDINLYRSLLDVGGKSVFRLFVEYLDALIILYCKNIKANNRVLTRVRAKIYSNAFDYICGVMKKDTALSFFQAIDNTVGNKKARFNSPFSYYSKKRW